MGQFDLPYTTTNQFPRKFSILMGQLLSQESASESDWESVYDTVGNLKRSKIPLERWNIGLLDQRNALSWVNKNIRAFGGDPSQVTIFGESAGGWSVKQLLIHPPSSPQFRAAILQSQAFGPETDNEKSWNILADDLGCNKSDNSSFACLSGASAESIRNVLEARKIGFTPIVNNVTNGPSFRDAIDENLVVNLPILIGTNADEGTVLQSVMTLPKMLLDGIFGNDTRAKDLARSAYPRNATNAELRSLITTDYTYTCTTSAIAHSAVNAKHKVWRYYFNASFPNNQPIPRAKAWHTSEIPLVLGTYPRDNLTTIGQIWLSQTMQQAWGNFAKSPESGPGWAAVGTTTNNIRSFNVDDSVSRKTINEGSIDNICSYYSAKLHENGY